MKASYELESKENILEEIEKHRKKAQEIEAAQACYTAQTEKLIKKLNSSIPGMLNDFSNLLKEIRQFNLDYCNITINIDECEQKEYGLQKSDDTIRFCFLESVEFKKGMPTERYGGYNKPKIMFFIPVKYSIKKVENIIILPVELLYGKQFLEDKNFAIEYSH